MTKLIVDPRHEYISDFVLPDESTDLFARLEQVDGLHLETGSCSLKPSHATVQWGPRQSYLDCVPKAYRAKSSGDIPEWLMPLKLRLEKKYDCYFDSIQVNKHFNENAIVHAHSDSPPGHICMVSLGAERNFRLALRFGSHRTLANIPLANGSLLTFFPNDQQRHTHEMPRSKTPCGARYALIFRYITAVLVREGAIKTAVAFKNLDAQGKLERKQRNTERDAEYNAVQAAYRKGGYPAVEDCLVKYPFGGT
jgi:alkylated DNA repair dioxygenase AlkB